MDVISRDGHALIYLRQIIVKITPTNNKKKCENKKNHIRVIKHGKVFHSQPFGNRKHYRTTWDLGKENIVFSINITTA